MRLIDADALKEAMGECPLNWFDDPKTVQEIEDWREFRALIDSAPTVSGWVSAKDKLPNEHVKCFIMDKDDVTSAILTDKEKGIWQWQDDDFFGKGGIRYWMYPPVLPEESKGE